MRVTRLTAVAAAAVAALVGMGGALAAHLAHGVRPALALPTLHGQATWAAGARPAPGFELRGAHGSVTLRSLRGRTIVLAFLRPGCARCVQTAIGIAQALGQLRPSQRPAVIVVGPTVRSVGPVPGGTLRLTGTAPVLTRLRAAYAARSWGGAVYLIDPRGDERAAYAAPFLPGFVAHDLGVLAEGK